MVSFRALARGSNLRLANVYIFTGFEFDGIERVRLDFEGDEPAVLASVRTGDDLDACVVGESNAGNRFAVQPRVTMPGISHSFRDGRGPTRVSPELPSSYSLTFRSRSARMIDSACAISLHRSEAALPGDPALSPSKADMMVRFACTSRTESLPPIRVSRSRRYIVK